MPQRIGTHDNAGYKSEGELLRLRLAPKTGPRGLSASAGELRWARKGSACGDRGNGPTQPEKRLGSGWRPGPCFDEHRWIALTVAGLGVNCRVFLMELAAKVRPGNAE